MRTKTLGATVVVLVMLCLSGLTLVAVTPGSHAALYAYLSLRESIRRSPCPNQGQLGANTLQVSRLGHISNYYVVTYAAECQGRGQPPQSVLGYRALVRNGLTWSDCSGYTFRDASQPTSAALLDQINNGTCGDPGTRRSLSVVIGHASSPPVASVEITYDTGAVKAEPVTGQRFAILVIEAQPCFVRALDTDGLELARQQLGAIPVPGAPGCPP